MAVARGGQGGSHPQSPLRKIVRQKQLILFTTLHIKLHSVRASMEEKRLEYFMMLQVQIHRSDTPSINAVIDRFAITTAET